MRVQTEITSSDYTGIVDTATFKDYLRFDGTDQDTVLPTLIDGAISLAEAYCSRSFGNKAITARYIDLEPYKRARIPLGPVRDITTVKRIAADGTPTELTEGDDYIIEGLTTKYITIKNGSISTNDNTCNYDVEYNAGPTDPSTVDQSVRNAIYKIAADTFENRENAMDGQTMHELSIGVRQLLANFRMK